MTRTTSASDWSDRNETYLTYDPKRRLVTTDELFPSTLDGNRRTLTEILAAQRTIDNSGNNNYLNANYSGFPSFPLGPVAINYPGLLLSRMRPGGVRAPAMPVDFDHLDLTLSISDGQHSPLSLTHDTVVTAASAGHGFDDRPDTRLLTTTRLLLLQNTD